MPVLRDACERPVAVREIPGQVGIPVAVVIGRVVGCVIGRVVGREHILRSLQRSAAHIGDSLRTAAIESFALALEASDGSRTGLAGAKVELLAALAWQIGVDDRKVAVEAFVDRRRRSCCAPAPNPDQTTRGGDPENVAEPWRNRRQVFHVASPALTVPAASGPKQSLSGDSTPVACSQQRCAGVASTASSRSRLPYRGSGQQQAGRQVMASRNAAQTCRWALSARSTIRCACPLDCAGNCPRLRARIPPAAAPFAPPPRRSCGAFCPP